jgi:uncharacterized protein (DUF302 family)
VKENAATSENSSLIKKEFNPFLESESKYGFEATVDSLTNKLGTFSWKLVVVHDLQQTLKKNGKDVLPVKVFALCKPDYSARILENDSARIISSLMPCRVSIYEKSDGKTYVSRMDNGLVAKSFGGLVEEVMNESSKEVELILAGILK